MRRLSNGVVHELKEGCWHSFGPACQNGLRRFYIRGVRSTHTVFTQSGRHSRVNHPSCVTPPESLVAPHDYTIYLDQHHRESRRVRGGHQSIFTLKRQVSVIRSC